MTFDTRLLTGVGVLAAVTEAGNFARAAEMLGLTPSGGPSLDPKIDATATKYQARRPRSAIRTVARNRSRPAPPRAAILRPDLTASKK